MRRVCLVSFVGLILAVLPWQPLSMSADAQQSPLGTLNPGIPSATALHVVTYIEAAPGTERTVTSWLKTYRDAARQEPGNQRVDVLQQTGRPTHFVVLETWENKAAFDAHTPRPNMRKLSEGAAPSLAAPIDLRTFNPFNMAAPSAADDAIYVVTHVDTIPAQGPNAPDPGAMLKQLAEASRKEDGNLRFDVWQGDRRNHFTVVEAWKTARALDAHARAAHTKQYRGGLQPLAGSPLDERVFTVVK